MVLREWSRVHLRSNGRAILQVYGERRVEFQCNKVAMKLYILRDLYLLEGILFFLKKETEVGINLLLISKDRNTDYTDCYLGYTYSMAEIQ